MPVSVFWQIPLRPESSYVSRGRLQNAAYRPQEYLTPKEIDALLTAARKRSRYPHRDYTAILLAYRHGLSASELCRLRWDQIDFQRGLIHVTRLKHSVEGPPALLRHSTGYRLGNNGVDTRTIQHYLGHKHLGHVTRYTELSPRRFDNLWED